MSDLPVNSRCRSLRSSLAWPLPLALAAPRLAQDEKSINDLRNALIALSPRTVDPHEAELLSETAHRTSRQLAREYGVTVIRPCTITSSSIGVKKKRHLRRLHARHRRATARSAVQDAGASLGHRLGKGIGREQRPDRYGAKSIVLSTESFSTAGAGLADYSGATSKTMPNTKPAATASLVIWEDTPALESPRGKKTRREPRSLQPPPLPPKPQPKRKLSVPQRKT